MNNSVISGMRRRTANGRSALVALSVMAAACGKPERPEPQPVAAQSDTPHIPVEDTCPDDGLWKPCTLVERLTRAGYGAEEVEADTTRVRFLSPPGVHYKVGKNGLLIAFYYVDSLTANAEWQRLDTLRLVPPADTVLPWPSAPSSVRTGNLIVAFFGTTAAQVERVGLALRAGLPGQRAR